ncbi:MAG: DUF4139 domain-containing protein [Alphaproteobacteria bacterium]|nr:MAG: DUF4139 domain-containing protein [Alphaproteobacteria bacterium]
MFQRIIGILGVVSLIGFTGSTVVQAAGQEFPVTRVILSTSGMAHFEHRANISKDTDMTLPVRFEQVDDVLKSLVVFDPAGQLGGVTLPGRSPLKHLFRDLPFRPQDLNSLVHLLNAYKGAQINAKYGNEHVSGALVNITEEEIVYPDNETSVTRHRISLLTVAGIRQYILEDLTTLDFADEKIRAQVAGALDAVREHATRDRRVLSLRILGNKARDVTVAYVVNAPLWKAAYRAVLPAEDGQEGFMQGWAIVENMTDSDWKDVSLSLVSGNPVTYRQQLYQSYYVDRPELPVEVFGRVMPRTDTGTVATAEQTDKNFSSRSSGYGGRGKMQAKRAMAPASAAPMAMMDMAGAPPMPMEMMAEEELMGGYEMDNIAQAANAGQSSEATTQVLFRFPHKFDLRAGQTMMLPFVSRKLEMEKLALYQPDTHATHPLAAVRIKNDSDSGFPPGILTIYEENTALKGSSFVGDASLPILAQGENRLISYALDSKTQIDRKSTNHSTEGRVTIAKGIMRTAIKYRAETDYTIKAPAVEGRTVLVEHPRTPDYKLVSPDPKEVEVTATHYRLKTKVKAGEVAKLQVVLERDGYQSVHIANLSAGQLSSYAAGRGKLDKKTRAVFAKLAEMRASLHNEQEEVNNLNRKRQEAFQNQTRLRENIRSLSGNPSAQKRYLERLDDEENLLEDLEKRIESATELMRKKQAEMDAFILQINI